MEFEWDPKKASKNLRKHKVSFSEAATALMKNKSKTEIDDELRSEYDLRELLKGGIRGKYAERYQAGTNLVFLSPA